jgi:hypothetical protein
VNGAKVECFDQQVQIFGGGLAVVGTGPVVRITEAAQIHREHAVADGEQRDEPAEGPPRFGEAMNQQDGRALGSRCHVVQLGPVDFGVVVRDSRQGGLLCCSGHLNLLVIVNLVVDNRQPG